MDLKVFLLLFFLYICDSRSSYIDEYKSYKDYKYYVVRGDQNDLAELKRQMLKKDNSVIYLEQGKEHQVLIAPDLNPFFLEISSKEKLNATLLYEDISEVIRSEKPINWRYKKQNFTWDAYYDVDQVCTFTLYPTLSGWAEGTWEVNAKTLRYPLSAEFLRHCVLSVGTQRALMTRAKKCKYYIFHFPECDPKPQPTHLQSYALGDLRVKKSHPDITEEIIGGESYEGRQIRGLRINTPAEEGVEKPVFFIESGIHAREWIAPATTTYFINQLLTSSDPNVTRLRDQFDWRIFPTVNPDGYHYSYVFDRYWRKTRSKSPNGCRGADPNRNWDYNWGQHSTSSNPCNYQLYAGSRPFSEIETKTLSNYISEIDNLLFYVAFHSYASLLLVPYSDSTDHVSNYDDLVRIGKASLNYGYEVNKVMYDGPGTAAETLYKASGGSMDWVRYALSTPLVYTYELRGSSFHWPASKIPEQGDEVTQMILGLATEAKKLDYY